MTPIARPDSDLRASRDLHALGVREHLKAAYELTKPRITRMVAVTAGVGFTLRALDQSWHFTDLLIRALGCVLGTMIASAGANALNMWWERARDARMPRTAHRPLPEGRLDPAAAAIIGVACSAVGVLLLALTTGAAPAALALITIAVYVLAYTPLKPLTTLNTIVGAVPGALPPLIGWTAAATGNQLGSIAGWSSLSEPGGWILFLLMFVWQIPHVLALAWMYKDDYAQGGYRMLPIIDPEGARTASTMILWSAALVTVSLLAPLVMPERLGWLTAVTALVSGLLFFRLCLRVQSRRDRSSARAAFIGSVIHLPVLLISMTADAAVTVLWLRA